MTDIVIAPARPDQPAVRALIEQLDLYLHGLYPAESNHLLPIAQLLAPNVRFLAAQRGGEILGIGAVLLHAAYGEIKRVYVPPSARGQGIARRLIEALIEQARAARLPLLRLETGIHQPEALALFRAHGFRQIGPFGDYAADPLSVFMERPL
jgi:putative acetyltransferase